MKRKVVFVSPFMGIWPHALPESHLIATLEPEKFTVDRITCGGMLQEHCTAMESFRVNLVDDQAKKLRICRRCKAAGDVIRQHINPNEVVLDSYLSQELQDKAASILGDIAIHNYYEFTYQGIEIGKIAAYEVLIKYKKATFDLSSEQQTYYAVYFKNALIALLSFIDYYNRQHPDILVAYSPQYAIPGVCARYMELQGKQVYFVEGSSNIDERYHALRVWDWTKFGLTNPALAYWNRIDQNAITQKAIARAEAHFVQLFSAASHSVYSAPKSDQFELRTHFDVPDGKKIVLAAMSSYDEVYSAYVIDRFPENKYKSPVFINQLEWIRYTIRFFESRPDLFLIIRVHPRSLPTRRNDVIANENRELAKILEDLPDNVRVNLPADKISIYDIYPQIDVLTTGWSATGVEAMYHKLPVVTYDKHLPSYPESIHYTGFSQETYFANLAQAAIDGKSEKHKTNAQRWLAFSMTMGTIITPRMLSETPLFKRSKLLSITYKAIYRLLPKLAMLADTHVFFANPVRQNSSFSQMLANHHISVYDKLLTDPSFTTEQQSNEHAAHTMRT